MNDSSKALLALAIILLTSIGVVTVICGIVNGIRSILHRRRVSNRCNDKLKWPKSNFKPYPYPWEPMQHRYDDSLHRRWPTKYDLPLPDETITFPNGSKIRLSGETFHALREGALN